jgi:2-keto-4-pentenoate hydratase/2-oxohepta-3-ene-1,7-dioic acid hydratase in catechol pathway
VGRNYRDHAAELGNSVPAQPLLFLKPATTVIGDGAAIVLPVESAQVDFEGEIGVVIGARLRRATEAQARGGIAGITCVNDVTARDLQRSDEQWTRAKGFDTFCPVGPRVVAIAPERWGELEVLCRVNGAVRQHGRARDMVFPITALVMYISQVMTLEPGDLIATGTPAGIGPLHAGDVAEVEIPGVGVLRNPVTAEAR